MGCMSCWGDCRSYAVACNRVRKACEIEHTTESIASRLRDLVATADIEGEQDVSSLRRVTGPVGDWLEWQ